MAELGQPVMSAAFTPEEKQRLASLLVQAVVHKEVPTDAPIKEVIKPKRIKRNVVD